jgi:uncharacterized MAPEG superfamily protein
MTDLFDDRAVPLHVQIEAAERELRMRRNVYPRRVAEGKMTQTQANREMAAMAAIVETLKGLAP